MEYSPKWPENTCQDFETPLYFRQPPPQRHHLQKQPPLLYHSHKSCSFCDICGKSLIMTILKNRLMMIIIVIIMIVIGLPMTMIMLWVLRDLAGKQLMGNLAPTWHLHTPSDSDHHIQHHIDQHIDHKYWSWCSYISIYIYIDHVLPITYNSHLIDNCTDHHIYHHA